VNKKLYHYAGAATVPHKQNTQRHAG
jgi:hypothetical protein